VKLRETSIPGVFTIELERISDERGFFVRAFCAATLAALGLDSSVAQINAAYSARAGTLRGLHWQADPHGEAKTVRCVRGAVYDVVADLRPGSPAFMRWTGNELSAGNWRAVHLPPGCAHAYLTLEDDSVVEYAVSVPYAPEYERGARWNDPALAVAWPAEVRVVSAKDASWPDLVPRGRTLPHG